MLPFTYYEKGSADIDRYMNEADVLEEDWREAFFGEVVGGQREI